MIRRIRKIFKIYNSLSKNSLITKDNPMMISPQKIPRKFIFDNLPSTSTGNFYFLSNPNSILNIFLLKNKTICHIKIIRLFNKGKNWQINHFKKITFRKPFKAFNKNWYRTTLSSSKTQRMNSNKIKYKSNS